MAVCKFWLNGFCRFGERCRNEHTSQQATGAATTNRSNPWSSDGSASGGKELPRTQDSVLPYALDEEVVRSDLTSDLPLWILSSYGPGKNAPAQLFGGPRERSFEEMRYLHYEFALRGRQEEAVREAQALRDGAEQQIRAVRSDIRGAIAYVVAAGDQRPNRIDECSRDTPSGFNVFARPGNGLGPQTSLPPSIGGEFHLEELPTSQGSSLSTNAESPFAAARGQNNPFSRTSAPGRPAPADNPFANTRAAQVANSGRTPGAPHSRQTWTGGATLPPNAFAARNKTLDPQAKNLRKSDGTLTAWNGHAVSYVDGEPCFKNASSLWQRIWFPDQPQWRKDPELPASAYDTKTESEYDHFRTQNTFRGDFMPELPPKREWCRWDF